MEGFAQRDDFEYCLNMVLLAGKPASEAWEAFCSGSMTVDVAVENIVKPPEDRDIRRAS